MIEYNRYGEYYFMIIDAALMIRRYRVCSRDGDLMNAPIEPEPMIRRRRDRERRRAGDQMYAVIRAATTDKYLLSALMLSLCGCKRF